MKKDLKGFGKLDFDYIATVILSKDDYNDRIMELMKLLVNKNGFKGAYVAVNKPYKEIIKTMKKNKIKYDDILFVDCITKKEQPIENCVFLKSVESLTKIGLCLEPLYKMDGLDFIFLDSLNGLSVYHSNRAIVQFARSVIEKIREHDMVGIFVGLHGETDDKIIDELSVVGDDVIELTWEKDGKLEWEEKK